MRARRELERGRAEQRHGDPCGERPRRAQDRERVASLWTLADSKVDGVEPTGINEHGAG